MKTETHNFKAKSNNDGSNNDRKAARNLVILIVGKSGGHSISNMADGSISFICPAVRVFPSCSICRNHPRLPAQDPCSNLNPLSPFSDLADGKSYEVHAQETAAFCLASH